MSLLCRKCRRLIRDEYINYSTGTCFCKKCNTTYRIPEQQKNGKRKGFLYRPKDSKIVIDKSEDEFSIKILPAGLVFCHF